jgi:hypothetical protein
MCFIALATDYDGTLAQHEAEWVQDGADPAATRKQIHDIIERRYTAPA